MRVSFKTAKLAKEKGLDIVQHSYYFEDGEFKENSLKGTNGYYGEEYEFNLSEFNENWNDKWLTKKDGSRCFGCSKQQGYLETFSAPTQAELQAELRKLQIHVVVSPIHETEEVNSLTKYWYYILDVMQEDEIYFSTWEEALEAGLQEGLTKIKN